MPPPRPLLVLLLAAANAAAADRPLRQADLARLRDPATRNAEAIRLLSADDEDKSSKYQMKVVRLHRVRRDDPSSALGLVLLSYGFDYSSRDWFDGYRIDDPDSLFRPETPPKGLAPDEFHAPVLERLNSCVGILVDAAGREVRINGEGIYLSEGYVYDFDGDGILDVADTGNYGVGEKDQTKRRRSAHVLQVQTAGPSSRTLFRAAYNWELFPENEWSFECFDQEGDGLVEIAFGPKHKRTGDIDRAVIFRWNRETKRYQAPPEAGNTPVFQLPGGELFAALETAYRQHGKPYLESREEAAALVKANNRKEPEEWRPPDAPYEFRSLEGADDAGILAFFNGRATRDNSLPADAGRSRLPEGFWRLDPKEAALQLAEANRTDSHRGMFRLAVDDRNGVAPPASGWLVHDYRSDDSYTYTTHLFAIRFGIERPYLVHTSHSSQGMVGANRFADRPAYGVRILPLAAEEARFLADTVFWLDRVRSQGRSEHHGSTSSSADGYALLSIHPDGEPPRQIAADTIWEMDPIPARWQDDYEPETCLNLVEFFLATEWPRHLGERWDRFPKLRHRYAGASIEERLKPRLDPADRDQLTALALEAFARHDNDPLPPAVLLGLVHAAGDEGLTELEEPIRRLAASLPTAGPEDGEFETLRKRYARDHFGNRVHPGVEDEKEGQARLEELHEKRKFQPGPVLRKPIAAALDKLAALDQPDRLHEWARSNQPGASWALQRLARHHPELHAGILREEFENAPADQRSQIFQTLAAANPKAALQLRDALDEGDLKKLILDIAQLELTEDPGRLPGRIPLLFEAAGSSGTENAWQRGRALKILSQLVLTEEDQARLDRELLAEFEDLDKDTGFFSTKCLPTAVEILLARPDRDRHWELLAGTGEKIRRFRHFDALLGALVTLSREGPAEHRQALVNLVRHRLHESDGFVNGTILAALALDLRELRNDLQALATSDPGVTDGVGAETAGGRFSTPQDYRYHAAREVLALWSETDPATRARMWTALVVTHGREFDEEFRRNRVPFEELRQRAAGEIRQLDPDRRRDTITGMVEALEPGAHLSAGTREWLDALCK